MMVTERESVTEEQADISSVGLGEVLRHLTDLLDRGSENAYALRGVTHRARYTPVMRALGEGPLSITLLQQRLRVTQGAVSQTVKLMEEEGLLRRVASADRRTRKVALTKKGGAQRQRLLEEWQLRLDAIAELESEIGAPLRETLLRAIAGLEREGFEQRIARARRRQEVC